MPRWPSVNKGKKFKKCTCSNPAPDGIFCRTCGGIITQKMGIVGREGINPTAKAVDKAPQDL